MKSSSINSIRYCIVLILLSLQSNAQQKADVDLVKGHVYVLASDSLQGRGTGTEGQKKAAHYISDKFSSYGIEPLGENYYDYFDLVKKHTNKASVKQGNQFIFTPWHFFYVSNYNHRDTISNPMLFVGFGNDESLAGLELKDKTIALLALNPNQAYERIESINKQYGNRTFFVIFPKSNPQVDMVWRKEFDRQKINLRSKYENDLNFKVNEPWVTLNGVDSLDVFYCFENALQKVFEKSDTELFQLAEANVDNHWLDQWSEKDMRCILNYYDTLEVLETENITGLIQGKDTTKTIVLTAHYDHLGIKNGEIYYGADDNASGTAALLEIARLLSEGEKPAYNVQFIAFSAEELGLLGSVEYVQHPYIPLSSVLVNINMDMLGRWDEKHATNKDFVYLLQAGKHEVDWYKKGKRMAKELPLSVSKKPGAREKNIFTYGSDHYSFYQKDVPVMVVFTGLHDDYHTPRDVPEQINYENLTNIATLLSNMVREGGVAK